MCQRVEKLDKHQIKIFSVALVHTKGFKNDNNMYKDVFSYYHDPVILRNRWTLLTIFRDLGLRKSDSKKCKFNFYVLYRVCTNIEK